MADESSHIHTANLNQLTIEHLCVDPAVHGPWIATVAFYKALHIVEAVFSRDKDIKHTSDHPTRDRRLKTTRKYQQIYKYYAPLSRAATIAR